jgi:hypothetical protein
MEIEPIEGFSQEDLDVHGEGAKRFKDALTEDEVKLLTFIYLHGSGENKLPDQDKLEAEAKVKLKAAGLDTDNYGQYIELKK